MNENPEELADQLLGSAAGAVVAARVLEKAGALEPEPPAVEPGGPIVRADGRPVISLSDIFDLIYELGYADQYGLPSRGAEGEGAAETLGVPSSSSTENLYLPLSGQDPLVPDSPAGRPQRPQETNQPVYDAQAREIAEYARQREELGLEPNDGNYDRGPLRPRWIEV